MLVPNFSGTRLGDGTPEGTAPPRRSLGKNFLASEVKRPPDDFLRSEVIRSHGENFLCSDCGKSSSVKADPESLDGVSESGLVNDSSIMGKEPETQERVQHHIMSTKQTERRPSLD